MYKSIFNFITRSALTQRTNTRHCLKKKRNISVNMRKTAADIRTARGSECNRKFNSYYVSCFWIVCKLYCSRPVFSDRHRVTEKHECLCVDQLIIGKIVYGDVLSAEIQILRRTIEGIGILGAVLWS